MANGVGLFGPALQAFGSSLMSGGDLTQTGRFLPQFQQAAAQRAQVAQNQQLRDLQAQRLQQQIDTSGQVTPFQQANLDLQRDRLNQGAFGVDKFGRVINQRTGEITGEPVTGAGEKAPPGFRFSPDRTSLIPIPGGPKDPIKTKEFRDQSRTLGRLSRDLTAYRNALKGNTSTLNLRNRRRLARLNTSVLLQLKNLEELGAITGPDLDLLQRQLLDPTAITSDRGSILEGVDALQNRVAADTEQFRNTFGATRRQLGFTPLGQVLKPGEVRTAIAPQPRGASAVAQAPAGAPPAAPVGAAARTTGSLRGALPQMQEGDVVRDNATGKRWQKVGGQLVPVDPTASFGGFGAGGA